MEIAGGSQMLVLWKLSRRGLANVLSPLTLAGRHHRHAHVLKEMLRHREVKEFPQDVVAGQWQTCNTNLLQSSHSDLSCEGPAFSYWRGDTCTACCKGPGTVAGLELKTVTNRVIVAISTSLDLCLLNCQMAEVVILTS